MQGNLLGRWNVLCLDLGAGSQVYNYAKLHWAAQLRFVPVPICKLHHHKNISRTVLKREERNSVSLHLCSASLLVGDPCVVARWPWMTPGWPPLGSQSRFSRYPTKWPSLAQLVTCLHLSLSCSWGGVRWRRWDALTSLSDRSLGQVHLTNWSEVREVWVPKGQDVNPES